MQVATENILGHSRLRRRTRHGAFFTFLALVSAASSLLCFPPGPLPLLAFVALVPLFWAFDHEPVQTRRGLYGLLMGSSAWMLNIWWSATAFVAGPHVHPVIVWCGLVVLCLWSAVPYAVAGFLWRESGSRGRLSSALSRALILSLLIHVFPQPIPGTHAHCLYSFPSLVQSLEIGGTPLLTFLVFAVNAALAQVFSGRTVPFRSRCAAGVLGVVVLLLMWIHGEIRLAQLHRAAPLKSNGREVSIISIQPNMLPPREAHSATRQEAMGSLLAQTREAVRMHPGADLVVWPELPIGIMLHEALGDVQQTSSLARELSKPLLVSGLQPVGERFFGPWYNTMALITAEGSFGSVYHKMVRVPFVEYVPYQEEFPFLEHLFPGVYGYAAGTDLSLLRLTEGSRIIPSICFEGLFTEHASRFVRKGGELIINASNDGWFASPRATALHLSSMIYRAVEYRVPLVRVTNTGNGAFVLPTGEILQGSQTPVGVPATTMFTIPLSANRAPYLFTRPYVLPAMALVFAALNLIPAHSRKRWRDLFLQVAHPFHTPGQRRIHGRRSPDRAFLPGPPA